MKKSQLEEVDDILCIKRKDRTVLLSLIVPFFILSLTIGLSYHWGYLSTLLDVGTYDQAVWGTLSGDAFLNTSVFQKAVNFLGFHFQPILIVFVPLYYITPRVEWLILCQSIALSLTAWPIYLLARQLGATALSASFWVIMFYANPFLLNTLPWVFHPETLVVPFIALAFWAIERKKFRLLLISCGMIMLCKEHFGVMVIGYGFLWGLRNKNWWQSVALIAGGAIYSVVVFAVIMPALSPTGEHVMLSSDLGQISRYGWLGKSFSDIFVTLTTRPIYVVQTLWKMGSFPYMFFLLLSLLLFPLAAPEFLIVGLADLAANVLSANPMPRSVFAYHSVTLIPVLLTAAMYGAKRFSVLQQKYSFSKLSFLPLVFILVAGYAFAPLPLPGASNLWAPKHFLNPPDPTLAVVKEKIGATASLSVQANIGAHFSQRRDIYQFPDQLDNVDKAVLRLDSPTENTECDEAQKTTLQYQFGMLDAHLQMPRSKYLDTIERLLMSDEFSVAYWNDPWLVLSRAKNDDVTDPVQVEHITKKLKALRKDWHIEP